MTRSPGGGDGRDAVRAVGSLLAAAAASALLPTASSTMAVHGAAPAVHGAAPAVYGAAPDDRAFRRGRDDGPEAAGAMASPRPGRTHESAQDLPQGVTPAMADSGRRLFRGEGLCYTCHGDEGRGVAELGSSLRDGDWGHVDGSYGSLVALIRDGLTAQESSNGIPMPPRGGAELGEQEVRALAAYLWVLSRSGG